MKLAIKWNSTSIQHTQLCFILIVLSILKSFPIFNVSINSVKLQYTKGIGDMAYQFASHQ